MADSLQKHLSALYRCRACPTVAGLPITGPAPGTRVLLVGQAPGPREESQDRPFAWSAGRRLFEWFNSIGLDEETARASIWISATIRCFPGRDPSGRSDRVPSPEEIRRCSRWLDAEIELLSPRLIIAVGLLAAKQFLPTGSGLSELVGPLHRTARGECDLIVLPHPSGRSTWLNKAEHRQRLDEALGLIRDHPALVRLAR